MPGDSTTQDFLKRQDALCRDSAFALPVRDALGGNADAALGESLGESRAPARFLNCRINDGFLCHAQSKA